MECYKEWRGYQGHAQGSMTGVRDQIQAGVLLEHNADPNYPQDKHGLNSNLQTHLCMATPKVIIPRLFDCYWSMFAPNPFTYGIIVIAT